MNKQVPKFRHYFTYLTELLVFTCRCSFIKIIIVILFDTVWKEMHTAVRLWMSVILVKGLWIEIPMI